MICLDKDNFSTFSMPSNSAITNSTEPHKPVRRYSSDIVIHVKIYEVNLSFGTKRVFIIVRYSRNLVITVIILAKFNLIIISQLLAHFLNDGVMKPVKYRFLFKLWSQKSKKNCRRRRVPIRYLSSIKLGRSMDRDAAIFDCEGSVSENFVVFCLLDQTECL